MVVKKKKSANKKPVQKTIKKGSKTKQKAPAKKVVKAAAKKNTKTPVKKVAEKNVKKAKPTKSVKSVKPVKKAKENKSTKPSKPKSAVTGGVKKTKNDQPAVLAKAVKKPVAHSVAVKPVVTPTPVQRVEKKVEKKQVLKVQSKKTMTEKKDPEFMDNETAAGSAETSTRKKATTLLGALEFTPYQPKADEDYMNDRQRDHFRKILDAWKQQLMQDVDLTVGHLKEEAVFYADPVDRAAQEEGFNLELRTRDRERKLIKKIEQSLDLLNTGEYGYCEDCGAEIGIRRLEARPTAVKCIDCKTFQEIREKQLGG